MVKRLKLLIPLIGLILGGCSGGITPVTGVSIDKTEISIEETKSVQLTANIEPKKATDRIVTWSSLDESIATISNGGLLTGVKEGKTDVFVKTNDGGYTAKCAVTVTQYQPSSKYIPTNIVLSKSTLTFNPPTTSSEIIEYTIFPLPQDDEEQLVYDLYKQLVVISSSDIGIASVEEIDDEKFIVSAGDNAGKASIKVAISELVEGKEVTGSCAVEVIYPQKVTGIRLSKSEVTLDVDQEETCTLVATIEPSNASNKNHTFASSNPLVASVSQDGKVTALKAGTTRVSVTTEDGGFVAYCDVTVTNTVYRKVFFDDQLNPLMGSNAHIHYYEGGKSSQWPGIRLDTKKKISKEKIFLNDRYNLDRDIYYWDVPSYSREAVFTNVFSDNPEEWNKWEHFDLTSYNLFQPIDYNFSYNNYNIYSISLTFADLTKDIEYSIPEWTSFEGYKAPTNTSLYKWVYKDSGENYVNGTILTSDIELEEVLRGDLYTVSYVANGAIGEVPTQEPVEEGYSFTVASNDGLTYIGKEFAGWSDGKDIYQPGDSYQIDNEDVILTAQWDDVVTGTVYFENTNDWSNLQVHTWGVAGESFIEMSKAYLDYYEHYVYKAEIPIHNSYQFTDHQTNWTTDISTFVENTGYYLTGETSGTNWNVASFDVIPYTIEYYANEGEGSMDPRQAYDGAANGGWGIDTNTFTRTNYEFIGWALSKDGEVVFENKDIIPNGTVTKAGEVIKLYAKWEKISSYQRVYIDFNEDNVFYMGSNAHIHYYNAVKGSEWPGVALNVTNKIAKESIILSGRDKLNRDLYYWDIPGYATEAAFTNVYSENPNEWNKWEYFDLTSYNLFQPSSWEGNYSSFMMHTISLKANDKDVTKEYSISSWVSESGYIAPSNTPGYKWVYEGTSVEYINGTVLTNSISLEEVECVMHTVTYAGGGASGTLPTQDDVEEGKTFLVASQGDLVNSGQKFIGWSDGTNLYQPGESYEMGENDVILTAQWDDATYKDVYFTNNNGWDKVQIHTWGPVGNFTFDMSKAYINEYDQDVYKATIAIENQFQFTDGTNYTVDLSFDEENTGYYLDNQDPQSGKWNVSTFIVLMYTINFDNNGGQGEMPSQLCYFGTKDGNKISKNVFTRDTYNFDGWATTPLGEKIYDDEGVINDSEVSGDSITLYAYWVEQSQKYEIKVNGVSSYSLSLNSGSEYVTNTDVSLKSGDIIEYYCDGVKDSSFTAKSVGNNNCWFDTSSSNIKACVNMTSKIYVDIDEQAKTIFSGGLEINSKYLVVNNNPYLLTYQGEVSSFSEYKLIDFEFKNNDIVKVLDSAYSNKNAVVFGVTNIDPYSDPESIFTSEDGALKYIGDSPIRLDIYVKLQYDNNMIYHTTHK